MKTTIELALIRAIAYVVPRHARDAWVAEWTAEFIYERQQIERARAFTQRDRLRLVARAAGALPDAFAVRRVDASPPKESGTRGPHALESVQNDVRHAARLLLRKPAFTLLAVATLALGVGASTTIFTIVDGVLLKPLGFAHAEELVTVWQTDAKFRAQPTQVRRWDRLWFSYPEYVQWRTSQRLFREVAIFGSQEMTLTELGEPAEVVVHTATPTLLTVLRQSVMLGRWFTETEQGTGADRVAVISHAMWTAKFGGDPAAINRNLVLNDQRYRIVGVMPKDFVLPNLTSSSVSGSPSLWIPIGADGGGGNFDSSYEGIGRLRPDVTVAQAVDESNPIVATVTGNSDRGVHIVPRLEAETGSARASLLLLTGGVALLLFVACVNIALLLLGEIPAREREFATRRALGASRARLARQLLTESVLLAAIANPVGLGLAYTGVHLLVALAPSSMPRLGNVQVNLRVALFSIALTTVIGIAFGLLPAVAASHSRLGESLRSASRQAGGVRRRMQNIALIAQTAMALVLLSGAVTLGRSLRALANVAPGFSADHVLVVSLAPSATKYNKPGSMIALHDEMEGRLKALSGVQSVGAISNLPLAGRNGTLTIELAGVTYTQDTPKPNVQRRSIRDSYFGTMRIPFLEGRMYTADTAGREIVVDEAFARRFWPNESAIAKQIKAYNQQFTIVGVVGSVRHTRLDDTAQATIYFPYARMATREVSLVIRTATDPRAFVDVVRRTIWDVDPTIPLPKIATMGFYVSNSRAVERYRTILLGFFGVSATLLTAVGVFGVTMRMVRQQRREIGIRLALGATPASVVRLVLRHQVLSVMLGIGVGAVLVRLSAPYLTAFVYQVNPSSWSGLMVTIAALLAVNMLGFLTPARQALGLQPARLIRDDG